MNDWQRRAEEMAGRYMKSVPAAEPGLTVDQLRQRAIEMTEHSRRNIVSALRLLQQAEQLNNRAEMFLEIAAVNQRGAIK